MADTSLLNTKYDGLTTFSTWLYGVGHVLNDLCAACWFNYLLYYIAVVQNQSNAVAGTVILVGQLADGIFTPIVGLYSDKVKTRIGRRKPWYILGTLIVPICFFFVFEECYPCSSVNETHRFAVSLIWYSFFAAMFNIGWASIQISHMSLIPSLTPIKETKDKLIGIRNGFTYISNIAVLILAFILIKTLNEPDLQFSILSIIVIVIGLIINILFIVFIDEIELSKIAQSSYRNLGSFLESQGVNVSITSESENPGNNSQQKNEDKEKVTWKTWMKQSQLYVVGASYTLSRLSNNVATAMMPFYLTAVLHVGGVETTDEAHTRTPWQIAIIPLCLYVGSTGMSFFIKTIGERISRKIQFMIGVGFIMLASVPMFFLAPEQEYAMIPLAFVYGIGFSFTLNNSMGFVAAFVGKNGKSGAFVWGFISLFDKFSSGIALFMLTNFGDLNSAEYIRIAVGGLPIIASVAGGLSILFIKDVHEFSIARRNSKLAINS
ncbi:hypothetical protein SteCoe_12596 [Stentor coeruleus]|uniref:Major facilitator superfamily (MFS) profile domain-containing protein n=1 Tax=Stentor coeruleus TaxID=5963 RepID=A0A1R2CAD0_9CILI|nr:hypothetical protein SteCoe_12596 [Stentor coeruleus]